MPEDSKLFALLIDGDNVKASYIPKILDEVSKRGNPIIRKVYLNKNSLTQSTWDEAIKEYSLEPQYVPNNTSGKNAADIALVIDAMELLYEHPDSLAFCIVSSDSDFTRLAARIVSKGRFVLGISANQTPVSFRRACSDFEELDPQELIESPGNTADQVQDSPENTSTNQPFEELFIQAYENTTKDQDGWAPLVTIKEALIALDPAFQTNAYQNMRRLAEAAKALAESYPTGIIEIDEKLDSKPIIHFIRVDCDVIRFVEAYRHIPEIEKGGWALLSTIGAELRKHPAYENGLSYHGKKQLLKIVTEMARHYPKIEITEKHVGDRKQPTHVVRVKS